MKWLPVGKVDEVNVDSEWCPVYAEIHYEGKCRCRGKGSGHGSVMRSTIEWVEKLEGSVEWKVDVDLG